MPSMPPASCSTSRPPEEWPLLKEMKSWAERATAQLDAKAKELIRWLNEHIRPGGKWSDERVIIFTEYRATQNWLQGILAAEGLHRQRPPDDDVRRHGLEGAGADQGGVPDRSRGKARCASCWPPMPPRKGIDLQNHCSRMIHYEIPWNPNRLEQRNGRIDRHGQKSKPVRIYHFVGKGYNDRERRLAETAVGDLEADLEFLMRAVRKVEAIREDLGKVGPVIADQVEEAMLGRRTRLDTRQAETDAEPVRRLLKFERDLAKQIKAADRHSCTKPSGNLRLAPENVQKVVEVALELAGQPPLNEAKVPGLWPDPKRKSCPVFHLPALTGSWEQCAEGLAHPVHGRGPAVRLRPRLGQGTGGCRARPPEPPAGADEPAAAAGRGLVAGGPEAAAPDHGPGRARLGPAPPRRGCPRPARGHRRRQPAAARGDHHGGRPIREGRFARFCRSRRCRTSLCRHGPTRSRLRAVKKKLLPPLAQDRRAPLRQALEARTKDRTDGLKKMLAERAERRSSDITAILTELQRAIRGPTGRPGLPARLPAVALPRPSRSSSSGTSMPCGAGWARSPARSRRRPRRSGLGSPTRSHGCSRWR